MGLCMSRAQNQQRSEESVFHDDDDDDVAEVEDPILEHISEREGRRVCAW